jgi:hypothetical protein
MIGTAALAMCEIFKTLRCFMINVLAQVVVMQQQ